jgi:NAD-dependent deacetylase
MDKNLEHLIHQAAELIRSARSAVTFTGAGISTPSGIPDFRSPETGLWNKNDPYEVASLTAFKYHPEKFYDWIRPLIAISQSAQPNQAHITLAKLEQAGFLKAVITQNIDGMHQKAGSKEVIELHGTTQTATCLKCGKQYSGENLIKEVAENNTIPYCKVCGAVLKPDIILYEELLPEKAWGRALDLCEQADVILVIGSSLEVYPANTLPEAGLRHGAKIIINTLSPTHLDNQAEILLQNDIIATIPRIGELVLDQPN